MNGTPNSNGNHRTWLAVTTLLTVLASLCRTVLATFSAPRKEPPERIEERLQRLETKVDQLLHHLRKDPT